MAELSSLVFRDHLVDAEGGLDRIVATAAWCLVGQPLHGGWQTNDIQHRRQEDDKLSRSGIARSIALAGETAGTNDHREHRARRMASTGDGKCCDRA
jgi:hypothetical protein